MPYKANEIEQDILKHWDEVNAFKKSVESRPEDKPYVFYDGPPFATGLPHYGHIVASLMKDVVPRYWTMQGYRVERKWGWDSHGLPIENIIEDEMNLGSKKDIEKLGITQFNEACRSTVLKYAEEWKHTIKRMGRWVDMENSYKTMDIDFMESVWWVFKELWNKDLIYEGKKSMHVCPRCVTPLSNFEVTQGYKDVKDLSVTAKFKLTNAKEKLDLDGDVSILAWTTTPWTLPGNVLLAVGENIEYVLAHCTEKNSYFICAKDRVSEVFKQCDKEKFGLVQSIKGSDLVGLEYESLFPYFSDTENAFRVVPADFVTTEDGTGVVHIAPAFGEDDYQVGQREKTGWVQHVNMDGTFVDEVTDFSGQEVKPKEDPTKTDVDVIKYLAGKDLLFAKEKFEHSYPHCWRCDTPLLNYSTSSWFVRVTDLKDEMLDANGDKIEWVPEHIKEGRFGLWLEGARDWAISRNRFWGSALPVWRSEEGDTICVGSVEELETLSGQKVEDLHKHIVDEIVIEKDGKEYRRIPEVLDCWFESGAMPYGQMHYPFENKEKFEAGFPAEFIAEGQDQTRGWFYTLHVLATALTRGENPSIPKHETLPAFRNVIVNGIVLAEDGKKMSKRLKNYPDPLEVLEKYGADAMRFYLVSSPVMHAESLNFTETGVREMYNKVVNTLWNVFSFYEMFSDHDTQTMEPGTSEHVLDKWVLAKLHVLVTEVTGKMNDYKLAEASRPILDFITELSQWYVRRSRDRFKGDDEADKKQALATLHYVLMTLSKVMAPFTPFIAEKLYQELGGEMESVHLEEWPKVESESESEVLGQMEQVRKVVEMGLSLRSEHGIKVRQPLSQFTTYDLRLTTGMQQIIAEELNVKEVVDQAGKENVWVQKEDGGLKVALNTEITDDLKKEGLVREIVRTINQVRKEQKLTIEDEVVVEYHTDDVLLSTVFEEYSNEIKKSVLARELHKEKISLEESDAEEKKVDGASLLLSVKK